MNERETGQTVELQGADVVKVDEFQYLSQQIKVSRVEASVGRDF